MTLTRRILNRLAPRATLDDVQQDVRYAFRQLRKAPLFTLTATVSLALGIGANAAVFTVVERVLLRPLPVSQPHELVYVTDERILTQTSPRFSYPFYTALRDNDILKGVTARAAIALNASIGGEIVRVSGELVSGSYFTVLGAGTQRGRALTAEDDRTPGAHPVVVISHNYWQTTFGADPSAIGRGVKLNGQAFTIVGIAAEAFTGTDVGVPTDVWLPMAMQRAVGRDLLREPRTNWLEIIGRLEPEVTRERAAEQLTLHLRRHASQLPPEVAARRLVLVPGDKGHSPVRAELGPALAVFMALTGLALALACINVASLVAVRSAAREKEIAIRIALGAGRSRLIRQLTIEGLALAALGGVAGLGLAPAAARLLASSQSRVLDVYASLDGRLLLFVIAVSVLTGLIVSQAPIFAARKITVAHASGISADRATAIPRRVSGHDLIVMLQIAAALTMLISGALLVQSLRSFNSVDPGFRSDNLLLVPLDPKTAGYDSTRIEVFWRRTLDRVSQIRGVERVSLAGTVPLAPGRQRQPWLNPTSGEQIELDTNFIGPQYFRTLGIPLQRGREFGDEDGRTSRPVVIVNERLGQMFWPEQDPIGKGVRLPDGSHAIAEVVGVVRDAKYRDLRGEAGPMFYRPVLQTRSTDQMTLHVRASSDAGPVVTDIRAAIQDIDRSVPVHTVTTLEDQLDASFARTRQAALMTGAFGLLAVLLSGIGVYGVTSLAVTRRTRDIGIRMALGARRTDIVRAVGGRGMTIVTAGLALGLLGSVAFARLTGTLLFGVTAADTSTLATMATVMALVAVLALSIPLTAATRLDPLAAIRRE